MIKQFKELLKKHEIPFYEIKNWVYIKAENMKQDFVESDEFNSFIKASDGVLKYAACGLTKEGAFEELGVYEINEK